MRLISLRLEHLNHDGLSDFLCPVENSVDILAAYLRALADGSLTASRNQLLLHVALHHVRSVLQQQAGSETVVSGDVREFARYARTAVTQPDLRSQLGI